MTRLTCELCGSNDLIKKDGLFVCQYCGTKYTPEEAKKMLIEGTVDVSGSIVKVDDSQTLENLYQIARRARGDNNATTAAKYYDMILAKDPTSWEAYFYSVYFKAMDCTAAEIYSATASIKNCLGSVVDLIMGHVHEKNVQIASLNEVVGRCETIASRMDEAALKNYNSVDKQSRSKSMLAEMSDQRFAAISIMYVLGDEIEARLGNQSSFCASAVNAWKLGVEMLESSLNSMCHAERHKSTIFRYMEKIQRYDPSYHTLNLDRATTSSNMNKGGCWVVFSIVFTAFLIIFFWWLEKDI